MSDNLKLDDFPLIIAPRHWVIVIEDGRMFTLRRHIHPQESELKKIGEKLNSLNLAGWLAAREGDASCERPGPLTMVHLITKKNGSWTEAERNFQDRLHYQTRPLKAKVPESIPSVHEMVEHQQGHRV